MRKPRRTKLGQSVEVRAHYPTLGVVQVVLGVLGPGGGDADGAVHPLHTTLQL